ncbi:hypothetical protein D1872_271690 [compost metagenome]
MLQQGELILPEAVEVSEPALQLEQRIGVKPVARLPAYLPFPDQPRIGEDAKMLGDGGPAHRKMAGQVFQRQLPVAEQTQKLAPGRIRDRLKDILFRRGGRVRHR